MMNAKAIKLIDLVLQWEGGYADKKFDGHETYRGITRDNFPTWNGWAIVDAHKPLKIGQIINNAKLEAEVRQFYYKYFYTPLKINELKDLLTSGQLFAIGVNAGIKTAGKLLQKAINKVYKVNIVVDGIIGKNTLMYANGEKSVQIGREMINQCNAYYDAIVAKKPSNKKFLKGWKNRVKGVTKACSTPLFKNVLLTSLKQEGLFTKILDFIIKLFNFLKNNKSLK